MLEQEPLGITVQEIEQDQSVEIATLLLPFLKNTNDLNLEITIVKVWGSPDEDSYGMELFSLSEDGKCHRIGIYTLDTGISYLWKDGSPIREDGRSNDLIPELYLVSKEILNAIYPSDSL